MMNAEKVIEKVASEFKAAFGKGYGIVEGYKMEDAEFAIVGLGSTMGTLKMVVDEARKSDIKAGLLKIRVFRPFPRDRIRKALSKVKAIAVLDRADSFNAVSGPLYSEITSALYGVANIPVVNYIYGLGGRDISVNMLHKVVKETYDITKTGKSEKTMSYLGVRE